MRGLYFPGWKEENKLMEYADDGGRIIVVDGESSSPSHKKKILEILNVINSELGSVDPLKGSLQGFKVYMYISIKKKIIGFMLVQVLQDAYKICRERDQSTISKNGKIEIKLLSSEETLVHYVNASPILCTSNKYPTICGVSRMWVSSKERRKGIATRLLNVIRHHFLFGYTIRKDQIAFSQPTSEGRLFVERYTGLSEFLVYF